MPLRMPLLPATHVGGVNGDESDVEASSVEQTERGQRLPVGSYERSQDRLGLVHQRQLNLIHAGQVGCRQGSGRQARVF